MNNKAVFGIANSEKQAEMTVQELIDQGFGNEEISILLQDAENRLTSNTLRQKNAKGQTLGVEKHTKASEGGAAGALGGGILGGTLGFLAGIGALAIPGLGPFIAAGPIMAALGGSAVGGSLGLLVGSLVGLGIPEYEAKRYEDRLKAGGILISVHCVSDEEISKVKTIFANNQIEDVATNLLDLNKGELYG